MGFRGGKIWVIFRFLENHKIVTGEERLEAVNGAIVLAALFLKGFKQMPEWEATLFPSSPNFPGHSILIVRNINYPQELCKMLYPRHKRMLFVVEISVDPHKGIIRI